jgi:hypothetical protein
VTPESIMLVKQPHALVVPFAERTADLSCQRLSIASGSVRKIL